MLDSKHWLAILCRSSRTRKDSGGIAITDDLGFIWWAQQAGTFIAIDPALQPHFPDPIPARR